MSLVTSIFVEQANETSKNARDVQLREQIQSQNHFMNDMLKLFRELDVNGSNSICLDEFTDSLDDERALAYFESIKLDVTEAPMIFGLIDVDKSGVIGALLFCCWYRRFRSPPPGKKSHKYF